MYVCVLHIILSDGHNKLVEDTYKLNSMCEGPTLMELLREGGVEGS